MSRTTTRANPGGASRGGGLSAEVVFGLRPWDEEVERYHQFSPHASGRRTRARSRKMIEAGDRKLDWLNCKPDGTVPLPGCRKLYVPLGKQAPSEAPYGFVFLLVSAVAPAAGARAPQGGGCPH
jgi:hypothetical protein